MTAPYTDDPYNSPFNSGGQSPFTLRGYRGASPTGSQQPPQPPQSPFQGMLMQRIVGNLDGSQPGGGTDPMQGSGVGSDGGQGDPNDPNNQSIWQKILGGINNNRGALSMLGQAAGGVLSVREAEQQRKLQQQQLAVQQQYEALAQQRQQASAAAFQQLYSQNHLLRPQGSPGTGSVPAQPLQQGVMQRLGYAY